MTEALKPIPLVFWKTVAGHEPVRSWLDGLPREDQWTIGRDIAKVQFGWLACLPAFGQRSLGSALELAR